MKKYLLSIVILLATLPFFVSAQTTVSNSALPSITFINPAEARVGEMIYVYGKNFNSSTRLLVDGYSQTGFVNHTGSSYESLIYTIPSGISAGNHNLQVTNDSSASDLSGSVNLKVLANNLPSITYINPTTAMVGETIYVYGKNLNSATQLLVDGYNQADFVSRVGDAYGSLKYTVPTGLAVGNHNLQVTNNTSSSDLSSSVRLYVYAKADSPEIFSATGPGPNGEVVPGYPITIKGRHFKSINTVQFPGRGNFEVSSYDGKTMTVSAPQFYPGESVLGIIDEKGITISLAKFKIIASIQPTYITPDANPVNPPTTQPTSAPALEAEKEKNLIAQLQALLVQLIQQLIALLQNQAQAR